MNEMKAELVIQCFFCNKKEAVITINNKLWTPFGDEKGLLATKCNACHTNELLEADDFVLLLKELTNTNSMSELTKWVIKRLNE